MSGPHSLYGILQAYDQRDCGPCSVAVASLLDKLSLTTMDPEHVAIQHHWANPVRLHQHHGCFPVWSDPDHPAFLGIDHPAPLSPMLQALLEDTKQPEEPFLKFAATE